MCQARHEGVAIKRRTLFKAALAHGGASLRCMRDLPVTVMVSVGVVLITCGWIASTAVRPPSDNAVYSVAQVRDELLRSPQRLAGQTVWMSGVLQSGATFPCAFTGGACAAAETQLTGSGGDSVARVPVALEPSWPLVTWLRRLPLVGAVGPAAQALQWGTIGTYRVRVQIRRAPGRAAQVTLIVSDVDLQNP